MDRLYEKKVYVKAFQFNGNATNFRFDEDIPLWAKEAFVSGEIKSRGANILYIDHREHTDFIEKGDYIIKTEFNHIFSLKKSEFEKIYVLSTEQAVA